MKNIIFLIIIALISLFSCSNNERKVAAKAEAEVNEQTLIAQNIKKAPIPFRPDFNPNFWDDNIKPIEFTPEQLAEIEKVKTLPPIIALRNAMNDYSDGKRQSDYFLESALGDSITIQEMIGLDAFSKYYFKDKYTALVFNDKSDNVIEVFILSANNPDRIFVAHLVNTTDNKNPKYVLKLFLQSHHTPQEIHTARNQVKELLKQDMYLF